ncbi:hypothetical protein HYQ45_014607 [Verticillium longisporum]|uniref:Uncharacterized protein n=1 Tax=Verticillium longisporum TaxID=100787 RepID=A0A8I2ZA41_VERLO|nr:hypothetical protein HYQ45_014607 [Verticillium longisporum]
MSNVITRDFIRPYSLVLFLNPSLFTSRSIRRAMDSPEASSAIEQIRISKIADRYLHMATLTQTDLGLLETLI